MTCYLFVFCVFGLVGATGAKACSCSSDTPGTTELDRIKRNVGITDYIFSGKVISVKHVRQTDDHFVVIRISTRWKGVKNSSKMIKIVDARGCGVGFTAGRNYLIYAYPIWKSETDKKIIGFLTDQCSRTRLLAKGKQDVEYLNSRFH